MLDLFMWITGQHTKKNLNKIRGRSAWAIISFDMELPCAGSKPEFILIIQSHVWCIVLRQY